jgi:hypothetical protein
MHARELVELAAVLAAHGPALVRTRRPISAAGLEQYWTTSKVRLDRWACRLKRYNAQTNPQRRRLLWPDTRGTIEDILAGEVLTRVWSAILCAHDYRRGADDAEPIARSVLIGHIEVRHRALTLLVGSLSVETEAATALNRLRRRVERWTDLLVGHLGDSRQTCQLAFDPQRAADFASDLSDRASQRRQIDSLTLASLRAAFARALRSESPNPELNAQIAASILACFPGELFDSTGQFRSLWLLRLLNQASDAQGMIDALLATEPRSKPRPTAPIRRNRC